MPNSPTRLCIGCRKMKPRDELLRLTVEYKTGIVTINQAEARRLPVFGRSAYLCPRDDCFQRAQKGGRLHKALEGRRRMKNAQNREKPPLPQLRWPIAPEVIKVIGELCTKDAKTCQNTNLVSRGGDEGNS